MHWYELDANNQLTNRRDLQISIDNSRFTMIPKAEARPFLIDWNRDGIEDLVVALQVAEKNGTPLAPNSFTPKLFIKLGTESQKDQIEKDMARKTAGSSTPQMFTPAGADLVVELKPFDFGEKLTERWEELKQQRWRILAEFAFGDVDSDGNFDLVFSERMTRVVIDPNTGQQRLESSKSTVNWMRNTSDNGEPTFEDAKEVYASDAQQPVISIAAADFDQDGKLDIVAQLISGLNLLSQKK